jgi:hypothetical protein
LEAGAVSSQLKPNTNAAKVAAAPIRVKRLGIWRMMPLTREQVKRACVYAEAWARATTWKGVEDLIHGIAWMIGEQLARNVSIVLVGCHDIDDLPVVRVQIGEFQHHIVFRDTRMLENDTIELLMADDRIEEIVGQRMKDAQDRQDAKAGKAKTFEKKIA